MLRSEKRKMMSVMSRLKTCWPVDAHILSHIHYPLGPSPIILLLHHHHQLSLVHHSLRMDAQPLKYRDPRQTIYTLQTMSLKTRLH